jgi:hypothetical protein
MESPACSPLVIAGDPPFLSLAIPSGVKHPKACSFARFPVIASASALARGVPA